MNNTNRMVRRSLNRWTIWHKKCNTSSSSAKCSRQSLGRGDGLPVGVLVVAVVVVRVRVMGLCGVVPVLLRLRVGLPA